MLQQLLEAQALVARSQTVLVMELQYIGYHGMDFSCMEYY